MQRVRFIALVFILSSTIFVGQNLVQNPSFEIYTACPNNIDQVANAVDWSSFSNTPDYNNSCSSYTNCGVPLNLAGYQYPHTGNAYCGVYTFDKAGFYREAIGGLLSSPLTIGQKYYVSFFTCLTIKPPNNAYAANKIGAKFSTISYNTSSVSNQIPIDNITQLHYDSIITDTSNWIQVSGSFIADSAYQYISLGNFFDDQNTDTIKLGGGALPIEAYYYVDDVCVSTDSLYSVTWTDAIKSFSYLNESISLFPNPTTGAFNPSSVSQYNSISVYNSLGEFIYENKKPSLEQQIDISNHPAGVYFVRVKVGSEEKVLKLVKIDP